MELLISLMHYLLLQTDWSVFLNSDKQGNIFIILAYVDDFIFVSSSPSLLTEEVSVFLSHFEGIDELFEWYLHAHISFQEGKLVISQ